MSFKRLVPLLVIAVVAALAVGGSAFADDFADEPCFDVSGPDTATCPSGTTGTPYSLQLKLAEGSGCGPGLTTWTVSSGTFPPGLTLSSDSGAISGTPTEAGSFTFYVTVSYPVLEEPACNGGFSDKRHTIPINPGVPQLPKLTIGPETTPSGTVGTAYSLAMTANLPDAKTWSILSGALPPGLSMDASTGVISGTPTASGSFFFTAQAAINAQQTDTKTLGIHVRDRLAISRPEAFDADSTALTEVGLTFSQTLAATGGFAPYTWTQTGTLPPGMTFDAATATLAGKPRRAGLFRFGVAVADAEGRTSTYAGAIDIAPRLAITTRRLPPGRIGVVYQEGLRSVGGVGLVSWRITRGPAPRGLIFEPTTGTLFGVPRRAGRWVFRVEGTDALGVKVARNVLVTLKRANRALLARKR
ncbi:MAG: Ig domain-containing protein [Gaiellaceae bacterium]